VTLLSGTATFASNTAAAPLITSIEQPMQLLTVIPGTIERALTLRLLYAALVGSAVGWERAASKHSAGIRTMALVSLGAAAFTICSTYGFGGLGDPSRMASNVASGVGFIGAGVITTQSIEEKGGGGVVSGLTTAAAIWISAAVGVASGVGMYYIAATAAACTIGILRFGRAKRKKLKSHIHRIRGTSELIDMSAWDEEIQTEETRNKKPKKPSTLIRIAKKLPIAIETKDLEIEDELLAEVRSKTRGFGGGRSRSQTDDDIQPLP
jgi:putative Mg2+ transporter-C (MgtC) family protein